MEIKKVHFKSDFKVILASETGWTVPFRLKFYTNAPSRPFVATFDGTTYNNCHLENDGRLCVAFDNHKLGLGSLMLEPTFYIDDACYQDGICDEVIPAFKVTVKDTSNVEYEIKLTLDGVKTLETVGTLPAYYMKGPKGDKGDPGALDPTQVAAINAAIAAKANKTDLGTISSLTTTDKSSAVAAINEVAGNIGEFQTELAGKVCLGEEAGETITEQPEDYATKTYVDTKVEDLNEDMIEVIGGESTEEIETGDIRISPTADYGYYSRVNGRLSRNSSYGSYAPIDVSAYRGQTLTMVVTWGHAPASSYDNAICLFRNSASEMFTAFSGYVGEYALYSTAVNGTSTLVTEITDDFLCISTHKNSLCEITLSVDAVKIGRLDKVEQSVSDLGAPYYKNHPYPYWKNQLKILAIGNSFTVDGTQYIDKMMEAAGNDASKICLYRIYNSGARINQYVEGFNTTQLTAYRAAGSITMPTTSGTLAQIVAQDWDVIIVQQASDVSFKWDTYGTIGQYIRLLRMACTCQNVCIGWQLVWGHTQTTNPDTGKTDLEELAGNIECCKNLVKYVGIDFVIPTGIAVQNARNTSLQTATNLTRDNWHMCYGVGVYVASCTWYQMLLAPFYGTSILGNTSTHAIQSGGGEDIETSVPVTSSNNTLCQKCAMYAAADMYHYFENIE